MIHAAIIVPLAFQRMGLQGLEDNKAFGWDERLALPSAIAIGYVKTPENIDTSKHIICASRYFIWDTVDAIFSFDSVGFVLHGSWFLCGFTVYLNFSWFRLRLHSHLCLLVCSWSRCRFVYMLIGFQRPFLGYYGLRFLLWETCVLCQLH